MKIPGSHHLLFFLFVILLPACKKNLNSIQSLSLTSTATTDGANYDFNWETAASMPVSPSSTVQVPMPWQSQSGNPIDPGIINDYKSSEGWSLVYNTFNTTVLPYAANVPPGGLYFALYNKFRGLLRFYLYIPPGYINNNVNIQHGLSIYSDNGTATSALNFDGADLVDAAVSNPAFTKANNVGIASGGGWYAMQYEIAYDPNFLNTVYPHLGFTWNSRTVNISSIALNGTSTGTLIGEVTQQSSGNASTIINGILAAVEIVAAVATDGESAAGMAAAGGLAGNLTGFFSGIFGGSSSNNQEVDLKLNQTVNLTGTIAATQPLVPNSLVVPGQTLANTVGAPLPLYASPLGVFNVTGRPTVNVNITMTKSFYGDRPNQFTWVYNAAYSIAPGTLNIVYNSAVTSSASVSVQAEQIVLMNPVTTPSTWYFHPNGNHEIIGNYDTYTGVTSSVGSNLPYPVPSNPSTELYQQAAVRIKLLVTPNNGAPASSIVKTFLADITHN